MHWQSVVWLCEFNKEAFREAQGAASEGYLRIFCPVPFCWLAINNKKCNTTEKKEEGEEGEGGADCKKDEDSLVVHCANVCEYLCVSECGCRQA